VIGIANVEDFKNIKDEKMREICEGKGLILGEKLILEKFENMSKVLKLLKEF
jgi:5-methylthioribose kinase